MKPAPASIGIDNGGSLLRIHAADSRGKTLLHLKFPARPLAQLPSFLKKLFAQKSLRPGILVLGSKGVWTSSEKAAMRSKLKSLSPTVFVFSDVELAYERAFKGKPGILLIAGTGSIAYGRNGKRIARAGGLGPGKGDEGSGYWIGKRFLFENPLERDPHPQKTAAVAQKALKKAGKADPRAQFIIKEATLHLLALVRETAQKLRLNGKAKLALHGGLFDSAYFKMEFIKSARKTAPNLQIKTAPSKEGAAAFAARMGLDGSWKNYLRAANPPR